MILVRGSAHGGDHPELLACGMDGGVEHGPQVATSNDDGKRDREGPQVVVVAAARLAARAT